VGCLPVVAERWEIYKGGGVDLCSFLFLRDSIAGNTRVRVMGGC